VTSAAALVEGRPRQPERRDLERKNICPPRLGRRYGERAGPQVEVIDGEAATSQARSPSFAKQLMIAKPRSPVAVERSNEPRTDLT
jgi:hypothetical protein